MAVDTLEFHRFTIDIIISSSQTELVLTGRCILNLNGTETSLETDGFNNLLPLQQLANKDIDIWRFSRPRCHIVQGERLPEVGLGIAATSGPRLRILEGCNEFVVVSKESVLINAPTEVEVLCLLCRKVLQCCVEVNSALAIFKGRDCLHVSDMHLWRCRNTHVTEDTRQAEHVLRLEETTIR